MYGLCWGCCVRPCSIYFIFIIQILGDTRYFAFEGYGSIVYQIVSGDSKQIYPEVAQNSI